MALVMYDNEKRDDSSKLKGIVPQHYTAYQVFVSLRFLAACATILALLVIAMRFVSNDLIASFTGAVFYNYIIVGLFGFAALFLLLMGLDYLIFLRKPGFDEWIFEFAQKHLGTEVIYYNSKCLYIQYNRASTKETDKEELVREMSNQSEHYSYYYSFKNDTYIDIGVIRVTPERKAPIPDRASFKPEDDEFFNFIPVGLTVNNATKQISPIGWYLNDNNVSEVALKTAPSVSFLIAGGTGCHAIGEEILMADGTIKKVEDIVVGDFIMGPDKKPREVLELHRGQDEMYEIETEDGNKHIVNGGHILPLFDIETKEILNMDVRTYLFMNDEFKSKMRIMKV